MILSAQTVRKLEIISPFFERTVVSDARGKLSFGLSSCGYDIRIAQSYTLGHGDFRLASSIEHFTMPKNVVGLVCDKSTWARRGISVQNTVIEPNWRGFLTLEINNHGHQRLTLKEGDPIAQILFLKLDEETEQPYDGKYQDQENRPVPAK